MEITTIIEPITDGNRKREICRNILTALPDWFGIPESVDNYVEKCADLPFWAAKVHGEVIGFISVKSTSPGAAEIYVMGILKGHQKTGIGRSLFKTCYQYCKENGFEFLQVKTLDKSIPDEYYAATRAFYQAMGFRELECIPEIWGSENPCMIMIMSIT